MQRRLPGLWLFLLVALHAGPAAAQRSLVIERFDAVITVAVDG